MSTPEEKGETFVEMMIEHHRELVEGDDIEARNAVIVKMISLVALAFGIPPISDDPTIDVEECMSKLTEALTVIERKS
jgi:hypothetical protein